MCIISVVKMEADIAGPILLLDEDTSGTSISLLSSAITIILDHS
jgi:hypothetical protein